MPALALICSGALFDDNEPEFIDPPLFAPPMPGSSRWPSSAAANKPAGPFALNRHRPPRRQRASVGQ